MILEIVVSLLVAFVLFLLLKVIDYLIEAKRDIYELKDLARCESSQTCENSQELFKLERRVDDLEEYVSEIELNEKGS